MKKFIASLLIVSSLFILIYSCSKDDISNSGGGSGSTVRTTISGMVLDENNTAVANVNVTAYNQTTTTNQYGVFVLKDVSVDKERCIIHFAKTGYFNRAHAFIAAGNTVNYVRVVLISNTQTHTINAATGGTAMLPDNSSVQFAANSFVTATGTAYTGTVSLTVKHLSPDAANFGFMIPGGDLAGQNLNGEDVTLYTYGMLGVDLKGSSGEVLQLAAGTTATLTLAIAASQQASSPATIPLWYFDEETSLWKEEGTATKVGNNYVGTVQHFTWWNCDYPGPRATIKGKVVDCANFPVPNVVVTVNGFYTLVTDQNGEYQNWILAGASYTIQVLAINNPGWLTQDSQIEIIPILSAGQLFLVPDLIIPCPTRVKGIIKTCSGEVTSGIISMSNSSGFYTYEYSLNGAFNLPVIPNAQLALDAFSPQASYSQSLTSLLPPNVLDLGNLFLCNTIGIVSANSFIINGGGYNFQIFNFDTLTSGGYANGPYISYMGSAPPDLTNIQLYLHVGTLNIGSYSWSTTSTAVQLSFNTPSQTHSFGYDNGFTNILQVDTIGGRVKGTYVGYGFLDTSYVSLSGNFDVLRTQ